MTEVDIRHALREVIDPELGVNIVDLGLIYRIDLDAGRVRVVMTMTSPACPLGQHIRDQVTSTIERCVTGAPLVVDVELVWDPPWDPERMSDQAKRQLGWADGDPRGPRS